MWQEKNEVVDEWEEEESADTTNFEFSLEDTDIKKFHKLARQIRSQSENVQSRLKSIQYDSTFVENLKIEYPSFPLFANLRCGQWYYHSFVDTCYFKSTDGHYSQWSFSTNRLNLNVLCGAYEHSGLIIVDSTRKGKRFPDALTKTIPIWVCVVNKIICKYYQYEQEPALEMPFWISKNEQSQIEKKLDQWVTSALECIDWKDLLINRYKDIICNGKYLRCLWVHRGMDFDFTHLMGGVVDFVPLICVSASDPNFPEKSFSWKYIQGAGDDHESWARGLTPKEFYDHCEFILEDRLTVEETEKRVDQIVSQRRPDDSNQDQTFISVGNSGMLFLSKNSVLITDPSYACIRCSMSQPSEPPVVPTLVLPIVDHRKYRNCLEKNLSTAIEFANAQLEKGCKLVVTCENGTNESVSLLAGILCALFNNDSDYGQFTGKQTKRATLSKKDIRQRFSYIQMYQKNANPSRDLMKQLNRYFI